MVYVGQYLRNPLQRAPGTPGQRIRLKVEIPDRCEAEGEGSFSVDDDARRMEWDRDYSGWLIVEELGTAESNVTVHLAFGPRSVEDEVQQNSEGEGDPMQEGIEATLESIRRQIEEASGKLDPSQTS